MSLSYVVTGGGRGIGRAVVEQLLGELPADSTVALFERAAACNSTDHSDRAVPLYRGALERGLSGERRRRAVIQMASSLQVSRRHA